MNEINIKINVTTSSTNVELEPIAHTSFTSEIAGVPVMAEVPIEAKAECERLLKKSSLTTFETRYLHDNYWVSVYYKDQPHGYHGMNDIWTYSARELPELPLLHEWMYSILGKNKLQINENITTLKTWEEKGTIHALGTYASGRVQVSFKPRGHVLAFLLNNDLRWQDKATYNTKVDQSDFPFYYSEAQEKIISWGKAVFDEKKQQIISV